MGQELDIGALYQHYKGNVYRVIGVARHSETLEELAIYQESEGERKMWARPLQVFLEEVEIDGKRMPRFRRI